MEIQSIRYRCYLGHEMWWYLGPTHRIKLRYVCPRCGGLRFVSPAVSYVYVYTPVILFDVGLHEDNISIFTIIVMHNLLCQNI